MLIFINVICQNYIFTPPFQFAKIIQDMQDFVLHGHSFALTVSSFRAAVKSHVDCAKDVSKIRAIFIFDIIRITKNSNIFFLLGTEIATFDQY